MGYGRRELLGPDSGSGGWRPPSGRAAGACSASPPPSIITVASATGCGCRDGGSQGARGQLGFQFCPLKALQAEAGLKEGTAKQCCLLPPASLQKDLKGCGAWWSHSSVPQLGWDSGALAGARVCRQQGVLQPLSHDPAGHWGQTPLGLPKSQPCMGDLRASGLRWWRRISGGC